MDKIAIISDVHGNLEALKAVLSDIKERGITRVFCLGDTIHKGVHSSECIKLVKENCEVVLQGNCDDYFTKEHDLSKIDRELEKTRIQWNAKMITDEDKEYLRSLPLTYEFYLSGSLVRIFHATPSNPYDTIGIFSDVNKKRELFNPTDKTQSNEVADIVVYGHIHTQILNKLYNKTLINAGSVGNALDYIRNDSKDGKDIETTRASYLILEGVYQDKTYKKPISYQYVEVPYDIEKELENDLENPEKEAYQYELRKGKYRDMWKVYSNFEKEGVDIKKI